MLLVVLLAEIELNRSAFENAFRFARGLVYNSWDTSIGYANQETKSA